jgi:hypothetical protein
MTKSQPLKFVRKYNVACLQELHMSNHPLTIPLSVLPIWLDTLLLGHQPAKQVIQDHVKSSAFAATVAAQDAAKSAMSVGMKEVEVNLSGPGAGRESAVRGLLSSGLNITIIRDVTPVAHNGCKARKRRRV